MRLPGRQRGLGLWGWIFTLTMIGGASLITLRVIPFYLNELAIERVVKGTADDPGNANLDPAQLRNAMQRRWDVEAIHTLSPKDVKIVKTTGGRAMAYDYEARAHLFYNISVVAHFKKQFPLRGGGAGGVSD